MTIETDRFHGDTQATKQNSRLTVRAAGSRGWIRQQPNVLQTSSWTDIALSAIAATRIPQHVGNIAYPYNTYNKQLMPQRLSHKKPTAQRCSTRRTRKACGTNKACGTDFPVGQKIAWTGPKRSQSGIAGDISTA